MFLAFLTDLSSSWGPGKAWLGVESQQRLWPPLIEFLSLGEASLPHPLSSTALAFCQDVGCEFLQAALHGNAPNKVAFSQLLTNALGGDYSMGGQGLGGGALSGHMTSFLHRLLLELVLSPEKLLVVLQPSQPPGSQPECPALSPSLSLPHTYNCPHFHPSFPISQHACCLSLPLSPAMTASDLLSTCQAHQQSRDTESKVTIKKAQPTELAVEQFSMKLFEFCTLCPLNAMSSAKKTEPKSILKGRSQAAGLSLYLPSSPLTPLSPSTRLSELLEAGTTDCHALFLNFSLVTPASGTGGKEEEGEKADSATAASNFSFLDAFISCNGLQRLALSFPSLYALHWPEHATLGRKEEEEEGGGEEEEEEEEEGDGEPSNSIRKNKERRKSFSLPQLTPSLHPPSSSSSLHLPLHSLVVFSLCLRVPHYCTVLLSNPALTQMLLRLSLAADIRGRHVKRGGLG